MGIYPTLPAITSGSALGDTPKDTPSEHVKPSPGTPSVQQGNNTATEPKSSGQSVYHRKVSIDAQSPSESEEITIKDPEFNPPVKIKKLALAIKIFCESFKGMSQVNNPETDRSASVESIRSKTFTMTSTVLNVLFRVLTVSVSIALGAGILAGIGFLCTLDPAAAVLFPFGIFATLAIGYGIVYAGCKLASAIGSFITAAVSASVDTCEKLAEMTSSTSPEEKFLNKYQRLEESLLALQVTRYAAKSAEIDDMADSPRKDEYRAKLESEALEKGVPIRDNEKWYDIYQRYCLREQYGDDIKSLDDAISEIEDWLKRASRQKALLVKTQQQDLNVEATSKKPDAERMEASIESPVDWILV